jgi:hypothetical protein
MATEDPTNVRFTESMIAAVKSLAARDGATVGAWIRAVVDREIATREGICPTCGQPRPDQEARRQEILQRFAPPQPSGSPGRSDPGG